MRIMSSQAQVLPAQVLISSITSSSFCINQRRSYRCAPQIKTPSGFADGVGRSSQRLGLFRSRLLAEVVVVGHAAVHHHVLLPFHRALGKLLLRFDDFLEERRVHLLLSGLVVGFELLAQ